MEGGEDAERAARRSDDLFRLVDEDAAPGAQASTVRLEGLSDLPVPESSVRTIVATHQHDVGSDLGRETGHHLGRSTRPNVEPTSAVAQRLIEKPGRAVHEPDPVGRRPAAAQEDIVEHEKRHYRAATRDGVGQRRVVVQAKIAPEPDHCCTPPLPTA